MKLMKYLEKALPKTLKLVRVTTVAVLAGCVLAGGNTIIAQAATLADVFDAKQYADDYADLKEAFGYDEQALLNHYLTYGIAEKRSMSGGLLDVVKYRETYADLDAAFGDNWDAYVEHFLTYGIYEGRKSGTDFDALAYANKYADVKEAFGDNALEIYRYYQTVGRAEGRDAKGEPSANTSQGSDANTSQGSDSGSSGSTPAPADSPSGNTADISAAEAVLNLVNAERAKEGLAPLTLNPTATAAAQLRAEETVTLFSHTRPDGTTCFTALDQAGVAYRTAGENIAAGQSTPEWVMESWMNSPGHRANILNANFTQLGVGYYYSVGSPYGHYWVQLFIG